MIRVEIGLGLDNLALDADGALYAAGNVLTPLIHTFPSHSFLPAAHISHQLPPLLSLISRLISYNSHQSLFSALPRLSPLYKIVYGADLNEVKPPSMGIKITKNTGYDSFMGQKYKVETVSV